MKFTSLHNEITFESMLVYGRRFVPAAFFAAWLDCGATFERVVAIRVSGTGKKHRCFTVETKRPLFSSVADERDRSFDRRTVEAREEVKNEEQEYEAGGSTRQEAKPKCTMEFIIMDRRKFLCEPLRPSSSSISSSESDGFSSSIAFCKSSITTWYSRSFCFK